MAFNGCTQLKKVKFPKNSDFLNIQKKAFIYSFIKRFSIYSKNCIIEEKAFADCSFLETVEFLSENIEIKNFCFYRDQNLVIASFPKAKKITFYIDCFSSVSSCFTLFICPYADLYYIFK